MTVNELIDNFNLNHRTHNGKKWIEMNQLTMKLFINDNNKVLNDTLENDNGNTELVKGLRYIHESKIKGIIISLKSHPEHYNARKIFGLSLKFKKQQEIETLAIIYEHYRNEYHMHYQHPQLEFKMDTCIVIELGRSGGLCVEIDEKTHSKYNKTDHEDRQKILESCGYYFVRIKPGYHTDKKLIKYIDDEIGKYKLLYSTKIDIDLLWEELEDNGIDKQFFDVIGQSIVCDKKYCVDFEQVVEFTGYSKKANAKRFLVDNFREEIDYVEIKKSELENHDDIFLQQSEQNQNISVGRHRMYIFLTKFSFYSFLLASRTTTAKEIREHVIDIYSKYHDLLVHHRDYAIKEINNNCEDKTKSLVLYKQRYQEKIKSLRDSSNREINDLKKQVEYLQESLDKKSESILYLKSYVDTYTSTNRQLRDENKIIKTDNSIIRRENTMIKNKQSEIRGYFPI